MDNDDIRYDDDTLGAAAGQGERKATGRLVPFGRICSSRRSFLALNRLPFSSRSLKRRLPTTPVAPTTTSLGAPALSPSRVRSKCRQRGLPFRVATRGRNAEFHAAQHPQVEREASADVLALAAPQVRDSESQQRSRLIPRLPGHPDGEASHRDSADLKEASRVEPRLDATERCRLSRALEKRIADRLRGLRVLEIEPHPTECVIAGIGREHEDSGRFETRRHLRPQKRRVVQPHERWRNQEHPPIVHLLNSHIRSCGTNPAHMSRDTDVDTAAALSPPNSPRRPRATNPCAIDRPHSI
jgi:hypothetical protein